MRYPVCVALGAALIAPVTLAEGEQNELEEIIVEAAPLNRSADALTLPANVLTGDELLMKARQSLGETLAGELGISASWFGPVAGRPVIRGQSGPRVGVLEGGVSSLDVADLSPDHAVSVEPLLAERIEVIRGPATLLYGSSAVGGVVNVVDARIPETASESLSGLLEIRGDTAASLRAGVLRLDGGFGSVAWHLNGFVRDSEDLEIPGFATVPELREDGEREGVLLNSFGETRGFAAGASWIGERGYAGVSFSGYASDYGLPGPAEDDEPAPPGSALLAAGPFIELAQQRIDLRSQLDLDGFVERLRVRIARNDYGHEEIEPNGEVATRFENDAWESRVEALHAPLGRWQGALGLQLGRRDFSAVGEEAFVPPVETSSTAIFLLEERPFAAGRLEFGARIESLEHKPGNGLQRFEERALSLSAGGVLDFASHLDLRVGLGRSERNPGSEELYANGPHLATGLFEIGLLEQPGVGVQTEVSNSVDVSLHHHSERLEWQLNVFYNRIDNFLFLRTTSAEEDGLPVALHSQEDADFYGIEAEIEFPLYHSTRFDWHSRLFADSVRAQADSGDLPRIAPQRAGAGVTVESKTWRAGLNTVWHAQQDAVSSFATDNFVMVDADWHWQPPVSGSLQWQVFARATNLLNEEARRSTSFRAAFAPLPGRSLHAGVRAGFGR